jgi:hypothetical protein
MAILSTSSRILGAGTGAVLAAGTQYFDKSPNVAATPDQVSQDYRIQNYNINNNSGVITQVLTAGQSVRLTDFFTEAGETSLGIKPNYYNISDVPQSTYLDEVNDKYLFPSNLYTYNNVYCHFVFRVTLTLDHPLVGSNQITTLDIKLKREVDDSVVASMEWHAANKAASNGLLVTRNFDTYVNGEADPYVVDGMYIEATNNTDSDTDVTLKEVDVRLFKL